MLQTPTSFVPQFAAAADADALNFLFHQSRLLVREADLALPALPLAVEWGLDAGTLQPLGRLAGRYCQAGWFDAEPVLPEGYALRPLRSLFGALDDDLLGVAARAVQIAEWARTHRYCGACRAPMVRAEGERCMRCSHCSHLAYPRISPAMMVLIRKGEYVLLARHLQSAVDRFVPLAGFLEAGESIEESIHREVFEEVGLRVHNLRYFASQSWPFPHSLMLAFTADYLDGELRLDTTEIAEARWFGPGDEWPARVPQVSISSVLVDAHRPPGC